MEKNHLSKILVELQKNPQLFKEKTVNYILGLTSTEIAKAKKYALANNLILRDKLGYCTSESGLAFVKENPVTSWITEEYPQRPEINLEYLKLDKAPPTLTRAIRLLTKHLLDGEDLKENSTEHYLVKELLCSKSSCTALKTEVLEFIQSKKRITLDLYFKKFLSAPYGLTKSIASVLLLDVMVKSKAVIAIYKNYEFQVRFDAAMFDVMLHCPENFELQKTVLDDMPIIEGLSSILMQCRNSNIIDLTKALIHFIKKLDGYTLKTSRLSKNTLKLRNATRLVKDPIALFYRDIPKILEDKILCKCDEKLVEKFEFCIDELKNSYSKLILEIKEFIFSSFHTKSREDLAKRFMDIQDYLSGDLKVLGNKITEKSGLETLWIERIATFIIDVKVPKDWDDDIVADFKFKLKCLADKFLVIESTATTEEQSMDTTMEDVLKQILKLSQSQRMTIVRKVVGG